AEAEAIFSGVGILHLGAGGAILVRGPDAGVFLNGLTTNNVVTLAVGALQPNLLCATKGKIVHPVLVVRSKPEEFLVLTEEDAGDAVAVHMEAYRVREAVELGMVNLTRLDLCGPLAGDAMAALGLDPRADRGQFREAPLLYPAHALGPLPRRTVLLPAALAPALTEALLAAQPAARLVGLEAYDEARTWAGVPRLGVDFDTDFLPAEAGLESHLSHNKGCYVGQEIHARLHFRGHPNRKLVALRLPATLAQGLAAGATLYAEGQSVGRITSLSRLERRGQRAGIGLLRYQVTQERPRLAAAPDGEAAIVLAPVATDLGAPRA
ncbi:MAG: hypothetical protein HY342_03940, partial [Candidatus Lambdaproteobacteria bacterium]|nr:hypothetical protein [Candidatus Lambdaproteobacteria bacterium]